MEVKTKIHFITYGNSVFEKAKERIVNEAKNFYDFESVIGYGPDDLDDEFKEEFKDILSQRRGGGYWIWRYHLIKKILDKFEEGEILLYADAGCQFNPKGITRFHEYTDLIKNSKYGILSFQMHNQIEKWWSVKEIFKYFDVDMESEIANSGQYLGGIFFIKKCKHSEDYVEKILKVLEDDRKLFTDQYNGNQEKYFKDNRHDQSVSSILRKIMGSEVIPRDETWFSNGFGCKESLKYPIWATRLKE